MPSQLQPWSRLLCFASSLALAGAGVCALSFGVADSLLTLAPSQQGAELAERLSPLDPEAPRQLGRALLDPIGARPADVDRSILALERAVALGPHRYLSWLALGRAYERAGRLDDALSAMRRAVELAPNFADPHWVLANALLRAGRVEQAAAEFSLAAASDGRRAGAGFSTMWAATGGDLALVARAAGPGPEGQLEWAEFAARAGAHAVAVDVWAAVRSQVPASRGRELADSLMKAGRFDLAASILRDVDPAALPRPGSALLDPGFESPEGEPREFGWHVTSSQAARVDFVDDVVAEGKRSVRITYEAAGNRALDHLKTYALVVPGSRYRLSFRWKTAALVSMNTTAVTVTDATGATIGAKSFLVPAGDHPWTVAEIEFVAPASGAVSIMVTRPRCSIETDCPVFGVVWLDGFAVEAGV